MSLAQNGCRPARSSGSCGSRFPFALCVGLAIATAGPAQEPTPLPGPPLTRLIPIHDGEPLAPRAPLTPRAPVTPRAPLAVIPTLADTVSLASPASSGSLDQLARSLLLANLPREYENTKNWAKTKRVWDGLHMSLDGLQIKTKRRWKNANHGTWTKYRVWLIDPERDLQLRFDNLRRAGTHRLAFDMTLDARLGATGRLAEWNRDVQLYSLHADAEAKVQLQVSCEMALRFDATRLPPDVQLVPRVTDARLALHDFQLQRISSADGPLVRHLGDALRDDVEREMNERRAKLVEKLNRSLEKNENRLRLSLHDIAAQGWDQIIGLPAP